MSSQETTFNEFSNHCSVLPSIIKVDYDYSNNCLVFNFYGTRKSLIFKVNSFEVFSDNNTTVIEIYVG